MSKSESEQVKEFTEGSNAVPCPEYPQKMTREGVMFIIRMVISELDEMATTVCTDPEDRDEFMREALDTRDKCKNFDYPTDLDIVDGQADAMVDAWYYMLNHGCKHGMNLSALFKTIHEANMNKRDPTTGKFLRRESDGKVIKPAGWQPADTKSEMNRQMESGSW